MAEATAVSWRRYFASESRKDRLMAQVRGTRAREVLLRSLCVLKGRGTWLVDPVNNDVIGGSAGKRREHRHREY